MMINSHLFLLPTQYLWVGIGCQKNTSDDLIKYALITTFKSYNLSLETIAAIATIEKKETEKAIITICQEYHISLITFKAEKLKQIKVLNPSQLVEQKCGCYSVAEASALAAVAEFTNNLEINLISEKLLIVPKQIIKKKGQQGSVTLAVANSKF